MLNISRDSSKLNVSVDTVEFTISGGNFDIPGANRVVVYDRNNNESCTYGNRIRLHGKFGSHAMHVRVLDSGSELFFEGSPYAARYGQNIFSTSNVLRACNIAIKRAVHVFGINPESKIMDGWLSGEAVLKRVDLAVNFRLESKQVIKDVLKQVRRQLVEQYGPTRSNASTVYWAPKGGKQYSIVLYDKEAQVKHSTKKKANKYSEKLVDECLNVLRIEVRLRAGELKKLGLEWAGSWTEGKAEEVFRQYLAMLKLFSVTSGPLDDDELNRLPARMRPVLALHKLGGHDFHEKIYSGRTCQRHRDFFRGLGIDLRCPNQAEGTIISLDDYLSQANIIMATPDWMIAEGIAPKENRSKFPTNFSVPAPSAKRKVKDLLGSPWRHRSRM